MVNGTKVTLIDIGKMLGVSASTVQRALNGLEGVGKAGGVVAAIPLALRLLVRVTMLFFNLTLSHFRWVVM